MLRDEIFRESFFVFLHHRESFASRERKTERAKKCWVSFGEFAWIMFQAGAAFKWRGKIFNIEQWNDSNWIIFRWTFEREVSLSLSTTLSRCV